MLLLLTKSQCGYGGRGLAFQVLCQNVLFFPSTAAEARPLGALSAGFSQSGVADSDAAATRAGASFETIKKTELTCLLILYPPDASLIRRAVIWYLELQKHVPYHSQRDNDQEH